MHTLLWDAKGVFQSLWILCLRECWKMSILSRIGSLAPLAFSGDNYCHPLRSALLLFCVAVVLILYHCAYSFHTFLDHFYFLPPSSSTYAAGLSSTFLFSGWFAVLMLFQFSSVFSFSASSLWLSCYEHAIPLLSEQKQQSFPTVNISNLQAIRRSNCGSALVVQHLFFHAVLLWLSLTMSVLLKCFSRSLISLSDSKAIL